MQRNGMLDVIGLMRIDFAAVLIGVTIMSGCQNNGIDFAAMDRAEKQFNERQRREKLILMPVKDMFPDKRVRALAEAAAHGKLDKVRSLVRDGVDVNARGTLDATPLFLAMANLDGFRLLLEMGADPNVLYGDGGSVMHWVARASTSTHLELALEHGGNPNLWSPKGGDTPLHEALSSENSGNAIILVDAGADINSRSGFLGISPTMLAVVRNKFGVALLMLERGADYSIKSSNGKDLVDVLIKSKARIPAEKLDLYAQLEDIFLWLESRGVDTRRY